MKKVLFLVCAMMLVCSTMSMAELVGDKVQYDVLFADESPYLPGDRVRVSVLVVNQNPYYQPVRLFWEMMDPFGTKAEGSMQKSIHPGFVGTLNFGKPLPNGAFPGLYSWTGLMKFKDTDGVWKNVGTKTVTFNVGDASSSAPGSTWDFYSSLYPDSIAKGESFSMDALVSNGTENEADVWVQSYITSPSGAEYILGPHPLTVGAMGSVGVHFVINPHVDAPSGTYTVAQQLVEQDGEVLNQVNTSLTISGSTFSTILGDALLGLAAVPEENKLDPEYDVAADVDNVLTLYNAGDVQASLDQALAIIEYLPTKFTTAGAFAPALDAVVDYLEASLNMNFTWSMN